LFTLELQQNRAMKTDFHQFKYLFGPVPSRRLGMSLGVDMVPFKTCTLDCVYCECGKTSTHTSLRKEYIPARELIEELDLYLASNPELDVITFAGSGEPTCNTALSQVVDHLTSIYPLYKTAILTNSSLLHIREVQNTLMHIDYALPSLDAVSQSVFEKINNPAEGITSSSIITGLIAFAKEYTGTLWVEIFIVPGINDSDDELLLIKNVLEEIKPSRVQLNTLDRPAACDWVQPATSDQLNRIAQLFLPLPVEIITRKIKVDDTVTTNTQTIADLCAILKRRPMTVEDIAISLRRNINEVFTLLDNLKKRQNVSVEKVEDKTFYRIT